MNGVTRMTRGWTCMVFVKNLKIFYLFNFSKIMQPAKLNVFDNILERKKKRL